MEKLSPVAFEALHIVSVVFAKFESIFKTCKLEPIQLYTLIFIDIVGKDYVIDGRRVKVLPEDYIRTQAKDIFRCSPAKISKLITPLKSSKLQILGTDILTKEEKHTLFNKMGTRFGILYLKKNGEEKIAQVSKELKMLKKELAETPDFLKIPNSEELGQIAQGLVLFLQHY